ncbi:hypothetical protein ACE193_02680 [Bernardetia sp. OM2101]|uniref:hypothetical protein n=1 Tax=Bernardetia sp. OM2101 TaxID=3344876 RepID=UPI0035CEFC36
MKQIINFGYLILILLLSSCTTDLTNENLVNTSEPFVLTINTTDSETGLTESKSIKIEVNSEKWKKIVEWMNNNQEGWHQDYASHTGVDYLSQDNFGLAYRKNSEGVLLMFSDKNNQPKQF